VAKVVSREGHAIEERRGSDPRVRPLDGLPHAATGHPHGGPPATEVPVIRMDGVVSQTLGETPLSSGAPLVLQCPLSRCAE
jgi:hypothetical protein